MCGCGVGRNGSEEASETMYLVHVTPRCTTLHRWVFVFLKYHKARASSVGAPHRDSPGKSFGKSERAAQTSTLLASFSEISGGLASKDRLYYSGSTIPVSNGIFKPSEMFCR